MPTTTLRDLTGLGHTPARLSEAALILIDCQNTYRQGMMQLTGVEAAIENIQALLAQARALHCPIIHIQHDAGEGSPYDIRAEIGQISQEVAPIGNEPVVTKHYPNAFIQTELDTLLKERGVKQLILVGFMTHMCINSTAHGAFNLGYASTVVANATATRPLSLADGTIIPADTVQQAALAMTRDLYATVIDHAALLLS